MKNYRPLILSDHLAKVFTRTRLQEASTHLRATASRSHHGYGLGQAPPSRPSPHACGSTSATNVPTPG
eukprot:5207074-Prorocentrum_lima.AAC.1